jgi:Protein of unknown function (DUF1569)
VDPRLQKLQQEIASAVAGMSVEQMSAHAPGKWCAAEILEHLYLTYSGTIKGFQRVVEAGKPLTLTRPTWRHRARTLVVMGFGHLPSGRKSPEVVRPRGVPAEKVLAEIGPRISEMEDVIARCEGRFGSRRRLLDHPVLGPLTAKQWRKFHLVHGMHHVKQLRRLREVGAFAT